MQNLANKLLTLSPAGLGGASTIEEVQQALPYLLNTHAIFGLEGWITWLGAIQIVLTIVAIAQLYNMFKNK